MEPALTEVLVAEELERRPSRQPDYRAEADAAAVLTAALNDPSHDILQSLSDTVVAMGISGSAGVSLRVAEADPARCAWSTVSGRWRDKIGAAFFLDQAPCRLVIERNAALLFHGLADGSALPGPAPGAREILIVPLHMDGSIAGAVWAVAHGEERPFEREDVRLLLRLGALAMAGHRLRGALDSAETARTAAADHLRRARDRLRQMIDGVPLLLWRATDAGRWTWAAPQWTRLTGQSVTASRDYGWLDRVHPDDRRRARRAWRLAESAKAFEAEYRIYDMDGDRYRWFQTRATPVHDDDGQIVEWLGTSTDIDDLETARAHQRTLIAELQHRVRNTLAVVRSIARRTADNSDGLDDFLMHFDSRLGAFARSQSLVANESSGVDLETLIAEELLAHQAQESERLTISGPPVLLKPKVADVIGLAVHELALNAVTYGGLSSNHGYVEIAWNIEGPTTAPMLALTWRDGAPDRPVPERRRHGFGSELIERSLAYDLDAVTKLSFGADGVRCDIRLPLTGRTV